MGRGISGSGGCSSGRGFCALTASGGRRTRWITTRRWRCISMWRGAGVVRWSRRVRSATGRAAIWFSRAGGARMRWWCRPSASRSRNAPGLGPRIARWRVPWLKELRVAAGGCGVAAADERAAPPRGGVARPGVRRVGGGAVGAPAPLVAAAGGDTDARGRRAGAAGVGDDAALDAAAAREVVAAPRALPVADPSGRPVRGAAGRACTPGRTWRSARRCSGPARVWAKARSEFKVREVNGQEEIELLADGSRWMLRAKEAVYGYCVSLAAADEAWKVRASSIEEGLEPTMVEREQPQLLLVSTAHRLSTSLMLGRRKLALEALELGEGELIIEWSAPLEADIDAWRCGGSRRRTGRRRREHTIRKQLEAARSGTLEDPEEPDPVASFRAQWLNQWPRRVTEPSRRHRGVAPGRVVGRPCRGRRLLDGPDLGRARGRLRDGRRRRRDRETRRRPPRGRRVGVRRLGHRDRRARAGSPSTARSGS